MLKSISIAIALLGSIATTTASAQDTGQLYIFKKDGEMPRVEAEGVDTMGAAKVHQLLGEDFVVFHGTREDLAAMSTDPVRPIEVPQDDDDPVLPLCQCPEDYTAALTHKLTIPAMNDLLRPKQTILAPSALPSLRPSQVEMLQEMIRNQGPLILQGQ